MFFQFKLFCCLLPAEQLLFIQLLLVIYFANWPHLAKKQEYVHCLKKVQGIDWYLSKQFLLSLVFVQLLKELSDDYL